MKTGKLALINKLLNSLLTLGARFYRIEKWSREGAKILICHMVCKFKVFKTIFSARRGMSRLNGCTELRHAADPPSRQASFGPAARRAGAV